MNRNRRRQEALHDYLALMGFFSPRPVKPQWTQAKEDKKRRAQATKSRNRQLRKANHQRRMSR